MMVQLVPTHVRKKGSIGEYAGFSQFCNADSKNNHHADYLIKN